MSTAKVIGVLGGGCMLLLVLAVVGGVLSFQWLAKEPEGVTVQVTAPLRVAEGDTFEVVALARNTSDAAHTLVDLDVANEYLAGLVIQGSDPPYSDAMHVPIDETLSHSYDLSIAPGDELRIVLSLTALREGDYAGDFDFCIDSEIHCLSHPARTVVGPAATP